MSFSPSAVDYLVIGHVSHDLLAGGVVRVGGTAAYSALTAQALGLRVAVLTSAGPDFDTGRLADWVHWEVCPSSLTTTFENVYSAAGREQFVHAVAEPLTLADLPAAWDAVPLVHIGPLLGECDVALIEHFSGRSFVGLTPQGWLRTRDSRGRIISKKWCDAPRWLPRASAVVISIEDLAGDWGLAHTLANLTHLLVVTYGSQGGTLFVDGVADSFSASPNSEVDPTGAGDIFAAAFFYALVSGADARDAVHFSACLATRSISRRGLASVPSPKDVAQCSARFFKSR